MSSAGSDSLAIAHVSNVVGGGMGTVFKVLLPAQVRAGHRVTLYTRQVRDVDATYFANHGVELGRIGGLCDLVRELRRYDVVHLHSADLDLLTAGRLSGRPAIFTLHGLRAQTRTMRSATARRLPTIGGARRRVKRAALAFLLRHGVACVTTVSEFLRAKAISSYGMDAGKVVVVYSGVALEQFRAQQGGGRSVPDGAKDSAVLGWVGRLVPVKRVDMLLRLMASLLRGEHLPGLRLLLVGDGELRGELQAAAESLGIAGAVDFTGFVDDPQRYLAQMDLMVFPSHDEGAALAVNEALAGGVPVVVMADGGGSIEIVQRSQAGLVAEDEADLARLVGGLLRDREECRRLGVLGAAYAARAFDPAAWAQRFDAVYRRVLRQSSNRDR